jgi:hypothetical protein
MNLSGLMGLSDVFSFGVNLIFQGSSNTQPLLYGEVDVLFAIFYFEKLQFQDPSR